LAFLVDFDKNPFQGGFANFIAYAPFLALAIAGPVLRVAALVKRLSQVRRLAV
jgi:D-alanyl-lipoteichoic acid acyltransferase DltB (MBOAT superfamily)